MQNTLKKSAEKACVVSHHLKGQYTKLSWTCKDVVKYLQIYADLEELGEDHTLLVATFMLLDFAVVVIS